MCGPVTEILASGEDGPRGVIGLIGCGAGGVDSIREGFAEPAMRRGWRVAVTLTPTAGRWLSESGEWERLQQAVDLPVRSSPRMPGEERPHPPLTCCVVAPATATTVAKLALGISDNQALGTANEAIGNPDVPVIVFPRVNVAHVRHPAWEPHLAALRAGDVHLVYGDDVWPPDGLRTAPPGGRQLPWTTILAAVEHVTSG